MKRIDKAIVNKFLKILLYICLISMFILFGITIILNVNIFTKDSHRLAEEAVRQITRDLDKYMEGISDDFKTYEEICKGYSNNDEFNNLIQDFEKIAKKDDYLGFTLFTTYGEKRTAENKYYESHNRDYIDIATNNNREMYYVYWNRVAREMCLSFYKPVNLGNGINLISGIKSLQNVFFETDGINDILKRCDCTIYFVDRGNYPSGGFIKVTKNKTENHPGDFLRAMQEEYTTEEIEKIKELQTYEFNTIEVHDNQSPIDYTLTKASYGQAANCHVYVKINRDDLLQFGRGDFAKVLVSLILTLIMFTASVILLYFKWRKSVIKESLQKDYVEDLNCSTFSKFAKDAEAHILNDRSVFYAMVNLTDSNIKYISEKFGTQVATDFRKFASDTIASVLKRGETYCWLEADAFLILISCTTRAECISKISLITGLLDRYEVFKRNNFSIKYSIGIYFIKPTEKIDIPLFYERSHIAMNANGQSSVRKYTIFDDKLYEEYQVQAKIEAKMEGALRHEEFYIFFQPKYNIHDDKIDGAESLVRWFDKTRDGFIRPDRFIKVFEMNGFINKLDRYVFVKVCEFLAQSVKSGMKVTPISVNVSRFTAIQNDFISFYRDTKQKYGIPNNYITIEFTESFSFEDMDVLSKIVSDLKACGFQCSIDDFGSGYSSCGMLKSLDMDELKLDMFLLKPTEDIEKDKRLVKNMVDLGKSFDMKVTQEGVETMEQLEDLKSFGCDAIQGFIYSKPLIATDFLNFVNGKTDLKTAMENNRNMVYKPINYIDFTQDVESL